jgi:3-hydroxybutyrate dehydrogenase
MLVLVTGAASGIGAAMVRRFVEDGADVCALDLDGEALDVMRAALKDDGLDAGRVEPLVADLADPDATRGLPTAVDVLVNNAGIQHVSPIHEFPVEVFERIHAVMLLAPFRLARHMLPHMYATGWGRVVNVSSVHGLRASPFKAAYVSAKHGLEGLSKVIALEGAEHGVTSNCINPAYVRTPLVEKQITDQAKAHGIPESEVVETIMLAPAARKRLIEPAEVAALASFLCTSDADSITGASLTMDGGWTAH